MHVINNEEIVIQKYNNDSTFRLEIFKIEDFSLIATINTENLNMTNCFLKFEGYYYFGCLCGLLITDSSFS